MGTWGTGLYQSDVAADVRAVYRDCKKLGFAVRAEGYFSDQISDPRTR